MIFLVRSLKIVIIIFILITVKLKSLNSYINIIYFIIYYSLSFINLIISVYLFIIITLKIRPLVIKI